MTNLYETVIADTSYEAELKAKEKFGNNFEIVNTETIKDNIYFGLGKQEKIKITIKVFNSKERNNNFSNNALNNSYRLPQIPNNKENNTFFLQETQSTYEPKPVPVPPNMARGSYHRAGGIIF